MFKVTSCVSIINRNFMKSCDASLKTSVYKEKKIKIGEWDINYLKIGHGPQHVLCMPGGLGSIWTDFRPQIEGFNRDKFTIVAWDPPGYGKSRPPERENPPDVFERDSNCAYELMQSLKIPKYSVLGWSSGGTNSVILAAKYPHVVEKLVIWAANVIIRKRELDYSLNIKDIGSWQEKRKQLYLNMYSEELLAELWTKWLEALSIIYNTKGGEICSSLLKDIKCPTLILYGAKDPMMDASHPSFLRTYKRLHIYPEGRHDIHITDAEDFNKRVEEFLLES